MNKKSAFLYYSRNKEKVDFNIELSSSALIFDPSQENQKQLTFKIDQSYDIKVVTSNPSVATVTASNNQGVVTPTGAGTAFIYISINGNIKRFGVTVVDENTDPLLKELILSNNVNYAGDMAIYYGYQGTLTEDIIPMINYYYAEELPAITQNMLPSDRDNYNPATIDLQWLVIHDTEDIEKNALAISNWCNNISNTDSSWHYTIGDNAIYQQLEDTQACWAAGDGRQVGSIIDLGYEYTGQEEITFENGYIYVDGNNSTVSYNTSAEMPLLGIPIVKLPKGNAGIPTVYYNSSYNTNCIRGGNFCGINIETCVDEGSDLYQTYHNTAKFCARKLVEHNLTRERVLYHNHFSGKICPKTMVRNGSSMDLFDNFNRMLDIEYYVAKNYPDATIEFIYNNELANRITLTGKQHLVEYTIRVTHNNETHEAVVYSLAN